MFVCLSSSSSLFVPSSFKKVSRKATSISLSRNICNASSGVLAEWTIESLFRDFLRKLWTELSSETTKKECIVNPPSNSKEEYFAFSKWISAQKLYHDGQICQYVF